jgi:hypothetical protein
MSSFARGRLFLVAILFRDRLTFVDTVLKDRSRIKAIEELARTVTRPGRRLEGHGRDL